MKLRQILTNMFFVALVFVNVLSVQSQTFEHHRKKAIPVGKNIRLDTLSILPKSVKISDKSGRNIPDSLFIFNAETSTICLKPVFFNAGFNPDTLYFEYKVFPFNFAKKHYLFHDSIILTTSFRDKNKNKIKIGSMKRTMFADKLNKEGSISRGISMGNNQDMAVNSDFNLQLSGKLRNDISILASISDNNIPIQAEGNTQQIQEFDKIFISIFNEKNKLTVGDFELHKPSGYFLRYNKKIQGGRFENIHIKNQNITRSSLSAAVAKGKFARQKIVAIEGNQGPYRLQGANNELFIIILSGSERIFIDGKLLKRGEDNDYTINYNTAELCFTTKRPITQNKRIVAEFEYSDKNYTRFLVAGTASMKREKSKFYVNYFSESDSKNQPLDLTLTDADKKTLSEIGDSLSQAFVVKADSVKFTRDKILYKKSDSLVNGKIYKQIFVYSTNVDEAFWDVKFSYLGSNKGDYILQQSKANGRVFKWIAPKNGIPQGAYQAIVKLATPKKKQVFSLGGEFEINETSNASFEIALSNNDVNTFSDKNKDDNLGTAINLNFNKKFIKTASSSKQVETSFNYRYINKNFDAAERFNAVEFERAWNLPEDLNENDEHFFGASLKYNLKKYAYLHYYVEYLKRKKQISAVKNNVDAQIKIKKFQANETSSLLYSEGNRNLTRFWINNANVSYKTKLHEIGIAHSLEANTLRNKTTDAVQAASFKYKQLKFYMQSLDSAKNKWFANYIIRNNFQPQNNSLNRNNTSRDFCVGFQNLSHKKCRFDILLNYRRINYSDTTKNQKRLEENISGKISNYTSLFKGMLSLSSFFETLTGMEPKKQFSYIEVSDGNGLYKWTDYNENGIREIDEFDVATFADQANYIRIYIATNDYQKVFSSRFSSSFDFYPAKILRKRKTLMGQIISKFRNTTTYKLEKKSESEVFFNKLKQALYANMQNPNNLSLLMFVQNQFSFNPFGSVLKSDYVFNKNHNKSLLINGFQKLTSTTHTVNLYFNTEKYLAKRLKKEIHFPVEITNKFISGNKKSKLEYTKNRDFSIENMDNECKINYYFREFLKAGAGFKYGEKKNTIGKERAYEQNFSFELNYQKIQKTDILLKINYIKLSYNATSNTPVAYLMLNGLQKGKNFTWECNILHNLTKALQLHLNYNGRQNEHGKTIHSGGVRLRANF